jgi:hypothetical protein
VAPRGEHAAERERERSPWNRSWLGKCGLRQTTSPVVRPGRAPRFLTASPLTVAGQRWVGLRSR